MIDEDYLPPGTYEKAEKEFYLGTGTEEPLQFENLEVSYDESSPEEGIEIKQKGPGIPIGTYKNHDEKTKDSVLGRFQHHLRTSGVGSSVRINLLPLRSAWRKMEQKASKEAAAEAAKQMSIPFTKDVEQGRQFDLPFMQRRLDPRFQPATPEARLPNIPNAEYFNVRFVQLGGSAQVVQIGLAFDVKIDIDIDEIDYQMLRSFIDY